MGTWGAGNFDGDTSADHLSIVMSKLIKDVETAMADPSELEPDEYWGVAVPCNLEILTLLAQQKWVGTQLPSRETIAAWKKTFLEVWERSIPGLDPKPGYVKERRAVLTKTFDQLAKLARSSEPAETSPKKSTKKPAKKPAKKRTK